ncbi:MULTISPECIES: hypothetical protein [unclassified Spirillospora]|uniref:hypothetical protein n=1 Tax=unclassified Spirillospora TaxID=2642701 RepID=UPI003722B6BA
MPSKLLGLRTVAGRVRALTALALLALAVLFTVTQTAAGDAREGMRALGHREGPMVVATADMYLALSDMDAQVTNVLLTGAEEGWLCDPDAEASDCERSGSRYTYDIRREDAQQAALQAARLAQGDPVRLRSVRAVLAGLHAYDQRVQAAMEAGRPQAGPAAEPTPEAVRQYRAATALMARDLLPKAYNVTLDGAADVDTAYREERSAVQAGRLRVLGAGLALVAGLASLQVYLARRFRRLLSVPLAAALAGTVALTAAGASLLATEADHLRAAKTAGFDPVLRLTRARAISHGLNTDRTRLILDPADADRYDQMYLEKSQTLLYIPGVTNLDAYMEELTERVGPGQDARAADIGGFYGWWVHQAATQGRADAAGPLLHRYRGYQGHQFAVRALAADGDRSRAVRAHLDPRWPHLPSLSFRHYDREFDGRISRHEFIGARAVARGDRALEPWSWLPPAAALAIAGLIVAGVWPRLSEYR